MGARATGRRPVARTADAWSAEQRALAVAVGAAIGAPVASSAASAIDWSRFQRLAQRHRVTELVHRAGWPAARGAPAEVVEAMAVEARTTALGSLNRLAVERETVDALADAGISVVVLKGLPLAQEAHGSAADRHAKDIDLLVAPEDIARAAGILGDLGLRAARAAPWLTREDSAGLAHQVMRLPILGDMPFTGRGHTIELHWRLTTNDRLMPLDPGWVRAPATLDVHGRPSPVLPMPIRWWHLFVHGAEHEWRRMKWLADVVALARRDPERVSEVALRRSEDAGIERCIASGLLLGERVLGPFLTPGARAWAVGIPGTRLLVDRAIAALAAESAEPPKVPPRLLAAHARERMALRGDVAYRRAEVRRLLLQAGRNQGAPDPRLGAYVLGPVKWLGRRLGLVS